MTADPGSPGRVPGAYQPAIPNAFGTAMVPSGARPSRIRELDTPILGMSTRTGSGVAW